MTALRSSNVADVIRRTAGRVPNRVGLRFEDRKWKYRELDAAIPRAAAFLLGLGLMKGDRVATLASDVRRGPGWRTTGKRRRAERARRDRLSVPAAG
jgi:acyl-CoA synthetase (AMP-forming)/AMP-acid ligase II